MNWFMCMRPPAVPWLLERRDQRSLGGQAVFPLEYTGNASWFGLHLFGRSHVTQGTASFQQAPHTPAVSSAQSFNRLSSGFSLGATAEVKRPEDRKRPSLLQSNLITAVCAPTSSRFLSTWWCSYSKLLRWTLDFLLFWFSPTYLRKTPNVLILLY